MGNFADADAHAGSFRPLAWSEAHNVPPLTRQSPVVPRSHPHHQTPERDSARVCASTDHRDYRSGNLWTLVGIGACVVLLLAACAAVAYGTQWADPGPRAVYVAPAP